MGELSLTCCSNSSCLLILVITYKYRIIQKHLKRQIISLEGGFQVISDLNAYHSFISTLRVPLIAADFANLKMLGHVYIVEDAKDLAQIVRDVTRYGGSFRPEVRWAVYMSRMVPHTAAYDLILQLRHIGHL